MITVKLNNVPTLFIKAFTPADVGIILEFVRKASGERTEGDNTVLFTDTPVTASTVEAVERLTAEGYRVVFRDHHGLDGEPTNDRERKVVSATTKLRDLLGENCLITVRRLHPACSTLIAEGEFTCAVAIIADPDADGLTAAMKAAGICYPELDDDAAKLDSEPAAQVTGSVLSQYLSKSLAVLPSYDSTNPHQRERAQELIFRQWVAAVQGNSSALEKLQQGVCAYDRAVEVAHELAPSAIQVAPGVVLVDVIEAPLFDPGTLMTLLEKVPGCRITVVRKERGPIAALHNIQYSLAVAKAYQGKIDLQKLVPSDSKNNPKAGIISNVSFLLHVSEDVWREHVLPGLGTLF